MTTLLTFLGTGRYETVIYYWGEKEAKPTHLFPLAATELFSVERVIVFLTSQAQASSHFKDLQNALGDKLEPVSIPEGRSEAELWKIFGQVADAVGARETVILDITHAFRSIPLIVFNVAAYLRRTKDVTIKHILYGAFTGGGPSRTPSPPKNCVALWLNTWLRKWKRSDPPPTRNRVPVLDLAPLLELLDWTSGAEALLKRGDAGLIAEKMIATHQTLRRTGMGTPEKLKTLGQRLQTFSQALHLSRPREVMKQAHELLSLLEEARHEFEQWALPFAFLAEQVRRELEPLAFDQPDTLSRENLERQLRLVDYYLEKGLIVQAVTLAREWVVSYTLLRGKQEADWLNLQTRTQAEEALNTASGRSQRVSPQPLLKRTLDNLWKLLGIKQKNTKARSAPEDLEHLSIDGDLARLWNELRQLRNDLAHCGMRTNPTRIENIPQRTETHLTHLEALLKKLDSPPT